MMPRVRLRELERLFSWRYGACLPNDPAGREAVKSSAHHIAHMSGDAARHIAAWTSLWAPWMDEDKVSELIAVVLRRPLKFKADTLGRKLRLSNAERYELKIRTIGAFDVSKEQRMAYRKLRRAMYDRTRRQEKGAMSRHEYLVSSLSRLRPWKKLGMSRANWYRKGKPWPTAQS
jgi:hypothetical protein